MGLCISLHVLAVAPADVGGCLALAGIDGEVARALVDADDLALVDVLPRLDEQPAARLNAAGGRITGLTEGDPVWQGST